MDTSDTGVVSSARAPKRRLAADAVLAVLCGIALGASFVDFRLFLVPWLAVASLLAAVEGTSPRRAFWLGYLAGLAGIALAFVWLSHAIRVFGGFPPALATAIFLAPVAWMALQLGAFTAIVAWLGPLPLGLTAPVAFTAVEFLFPTLFPWRLAHTQYRVVPLLQSGDVAGPSLLTFAMVWASVALLAAYRRLRQRGSTPHASGGRSAIVLPLLLVLALFAYGTWRLTTVRELRARAPGLRVGVVQGNIGVERKGERSFLTRNLEDYRALSRTIAPTVDLLVWPETVASTPIAADRTVLAGEDNPFPDLPRPLAFGGLALEMLGGQQRVFNSAFVLREDGTIAGRYDKRVLVPFGEYMPLADRFPRLRRLSAATGHFSAGHTATTLKLDARARLGPLICYEDVIPTPARELVAGGATLLLNLTNDAWYGDSAEPRQHQALAIWRAVENRRDFVRSTNTGLTSVISATGEVVAELPVFQAATLTAEVRLLEEPTFYATYGDVFAWSVVAALLLCAAWRILRRDSARLSPGMRPRAASA